MLSQPRCSSVGKIEMSQGNQIHRAPNGKFYAVWRGEPICRMSGGLFYFDTDREALEFLNQCDIESRVADLEAFAI
jgi:hypothetical protein